MYLNTTFPFIHFRQPAPKKAVVTETYDISPEALPEILRLCDAYHKATFNADRFENWAFWATISRDVPAVAQNPQGWGFYKRNPLHYFVSRTI